MSGKWHVAQTPTDRGFDRYFGFLSGCINFFTGEDWGSGDQWGTGENLMRLDDEEYTCPEDFYSTDAFTDFAIEFLDEALAKEAPFFLYLAHNAPHFPLHALPDDIAKYRGRYDVGWDVIRERRYERLLELEIIDENWPLSDRDPKNEPWEQMTSAERKFLLPLIETYAAMVDRLDQNVGRLIHYLESRQELENTVIVFLSDNGACPYQRMRNEVRVPGPAESDIAYDARWANMCNAPLRLYKQYAHNGGTLTPMIVHWPAGIARRGQISGFNGHLVDFMPTVIELAGTSYPTRVQGHEIFPMEGESLVPVLRGNADPAREKPVFWEFSGNHGVRLQHWKLVAERSKPWELYDLRNDRTETRDVSPQHEERVAELSRIYDAWAKRTNAKTHAKCLSTKPSTQSQLFNLDEITH